MNLAVRFLLELVAFVAAGFWGWNLSESMQRFLLAIGIPVLMAIVWGVFNVPNDPSRSGKAPVQVPGAVRLVLEIAVLGFGIWCLFDLGYTKIGIVICVIFYAHYVISYDRIAWLLRH